MMLTAGLILCLCPSQAFADYTLTPVFIGAARRVDDALRAMETMPLTVDAVRQAEVSLKEADALLGPDLAAYDSPPAWCQARKLDGLFVVALFNQFNETADAVEGAQKLDNGLVWQMAAESRRYVQQKLDSLSLAKRVLGPEHYRLYRAGAADGESPAGVTSPWVRWSGVRYGYDVGRFHRQETLTSGTQGVSRHTDVVPIPWAPAAREPATP